MRRKLLLYQLCTALALAFISSILLSCFNTPDESRECSWRARDKSAALTYSTERLHSAEMAPPTALHSKHSALQRDQPLQMPHVGLDKPADVRAPHPLDDCCGRSARVKLAESARMGEIFHALFFGADRLQMAGDSQSWRRGDVHRCGGKPRFERHLSKSRAALRFSRFFESCHFIRLTQLF
jgi:hypothetical protein